jgi:hypothetical protein
MSIENLKSYGMLAPITARSHHRRDASTSASSPLPLVPRDPLLLRVLGHARAEPAYPSTPRVPP